MPLKLLPMEPDDCVAWMRIRLVAYAGPTHDLVHTRPLSEDSLLKVAEDRKKNFHAPGTYRWKVIDTNTNNEIISCAQWSLHNYNSETTDPRAEEPDGVDDAEDRGPTDPRWKSTASNAGPPFVPPEVNMEILMALLDPLREAGKEIMGDRPYLMLNTLSTHPSHYRRGSGAMLVQWGVETADELGIDMYLDCSLMAKPLYERFGFELVRGIPFDRMKWGGEGVDWHGCMVRKAKKKPHTPTIGS